MSKAIEEQLEVEQELDNIVEQTSSGGKQSAIQGLPTLIPPYALMAISATMKRGSKYGVENWHNIPVMATEVDEKDGKAVVDTGELDHALQHYLNFMTEACHDPMEELAHFAARALMALDQYARENLRDFETFIEREGR